MQIDLRKIPTFVITLGNPARFDFVSRQLNRAGIQPRFVQGIKCNPGIIGCALSHLRVLEIAPEPPFLVLEDDVAVSSDFTPIVNVPYDSCGASISGVYLGVSTWGSDGKRGVQNGTIAQEHAPGWLRVFNMCSSHAILYLEQMYVDAAHRRIWQSILDETPFDVGLANLQSVDDERHHILTPEKPFFYQAACVGGHEEATRNPLQVSTTVS